MKLNIGVLLIGSLYWDNQPHRKKWREDRLKMNEVAEVTVPIRYGRNSSSRGNTYTMVFSPGCQPGRAKAVLCIPSVTSLEELVDEAECLWIAEQPSNADLKVKRKLSANWGCVALLAHPKFQVGPSKELLQPVLDGWAKRVALEKNYDGKKYDGPDGHCLVDNKGILQIRWPDRSDSSEPLPFDVLLATATKATPHEKTRDYPSATVVAQAWKADKEGHDEYFWRNRECGITTFQDEAILKYLQPQ